MGVQVIDARAEFLTGLHRFLDEVGWSLSKMSKAAGISASTLSQFIADKYPGDWDKVSAKLGGVMARERERSAVPQAVKEFVETTVSLRVFDVARSCHMIGEIGVCYSAAGLGKTESVREYARQHPDVILVEADPGYTADVLFRELRGRLGDSARYLSLHDGFVECCHRLKGSGRLLIIDEAEQLPYKALEMVRRLHDKTGIGVLLAGMPKLLANLKGNRGEYAQLYSRVGIAIKLQSITEDDTAAILDSVLLGCGEGVKAAFHKEAAGNTRRLFKLITRAKHIAHLNKKDITERVIARAAGYVKLEVMS